MKFIISSSTLSKALQTVNGVILSHNTLPILDNFLFELNDGELKITASDLETTMTIAIVPDMAEEFGRIAVPAKIFLETIRTFSNIPITFKSNPETYGITILTEEGNFKVAGQNADEYPKQPEIADASLTTLKSEHVASAIHYTLIATGSDEMRPVMSGVYCEMDNDNITFVATDAHKLSRYRRTDVSTGINTSFILPKKPLQQLKNALADIDTNVNVEYNEKNAYFAFENIQLYCRLIDGVYPNYNVVIPQENPNKLIVDRVQLINSLRRVGIYANQSTQQVRFKISGKELFLSAEDTDYSNEAKERLNCNYDGEDMEIGFSSKYMIELVNIIEGEQVLIELSAPNKAGLISPATKIDPEEDLLLLIMPVMLTGSN